MDYIINGLSILAGSMLGHIFSRLFIDSNAPYQIKPAEALKSLKACLTPKKPGIFISPSSKDKIDRFMDGLDKE